MKRFAAVLCALVASCYATLSPAQTAEPSEADKKAYGYLRAYSEWKQMPVAVLDMCKKADPTGAEARQATFDKWKAAHEQDFVLFDSFGNDILPQLAPATAATSQRPIDMYDGHTRAKMTMGLAFATPEKKMGFCNRFTSSDLLGDLGVKEEAATYLKEWLHTHSAKPPAKPTDAQQGVPADGSRPAGEPRR